jgi:ankyrin repeat protein
VDAADEDGWTALHFAAQNQDERIIDTLVSAGANKALKDGEGKLACERYSGWDKRIHKLLKP